MIELKTVFVKGNSDKDFIDALMELGEIDADFNGENGAGYLCDNAMEYGYESNLEYVAHEVEKIRNKSLCAETFVNMWMEHDGYYNDYKISIVYDNKNKPVSISLAFEHDH